MSLPKVPAELRSLRAVIYCRVSTKKQEDGESLENQEDEGRTYCALHGYQVVHVEREVHTGADLDGRDGLHRVRDMARNHQADVVIVWKFDRLSRNMTHQAIVCYELEREGVSIEAVKETFDNSPHGRLLRSIIGYVAEIERENIKQRSSAGQLRRVMSGKPMASGMGAPYGYQYTEEKDGYLLDPTTAPLIRQLYSWADQDLSLRWMCKELARQGVKTPKGKDLWHSGTIADMLRNPIYKGKPRAMRHQYTKGDVVSQKTGRVKLGDKVTVREGIELPPCQPIVDEDLWDRVQLKLVTREFKTGRKYERGMLEGFIFCVCGARMRRMEHPRTPAYKCIRNGSTPGTTCQASIMTERVEEAVWGMVLEELRNPSQLMASILDKMKKPPSPNTLTEQRDELNGRKRRLLDTLAMTDDEQIRADLLQDLHGVNETLTAIGDELSKVAQKTIEYEERQEALNLVVAQAVGILDGEEPSVEDKRRVLYALGVRVDLSNEREQLPKGVRSGRRGRLFTVQFGAELQYHAVWSFTMPTLYCFEFRVKLVLPLATHYVNRVS